MQPRVIHQPIILYHLKLNRLTYTSRAANVPSSPFQRQSFIRMQFSTIAWIVTALMAGQTLATPAKKAGTSIFRPRASLLWRHVYLGAHLLIVAVCSDRWTSMHRLRIQLTARRCLQGREMQHRNPSERAGHCGQRRLCITGIKEHIPLKSIVSIFLWVGFCYEREEL